jgi:hypothetical protein
VCYIFDKRILFVLDHYIPLISKYVLSLLSLRINLVTFLSTNLSLIVVSLRIDMLRICISVFICVY